MSEITREESETLENWARDNLSESKYPGMTYEQGIIDALEVFNGSLSVEDLIGEDDG